MNGLYWDGRRRVWVRARMRGGSPRLEAAKIVASEGADDGLEALAGLGRGELRLAIPGRDAILRYVHLPAVPPWRLRLLMASEVEEIEEKVGEPLCADFRLLSLPPDARAMSAEGLPLSVVVALAKQRPQLERIEALSRHGLRVGALLPASIALFDAWVALGHCDDETVLLVDAGRESVEVAIAQGGALLFARSLPGLAAADTRQIQQLATSLGSTLHFARDQQKLRTLQIDAVRLSGPLARNVALAEAIGTVLHAPVGVFDPIERLALAPGLEASCAERGPELVIALGLALADAHPRALELDMLPPEVARRRAFWRHRVWLYGGAAAAAIAVAVAIGGALVSRARARAVLSSLRTRRAVLESRLEDLDALAQRNRAQLAAYGALTRHAERGAAALTLLDLLGELAPERIAIERVALATDTPRSQRPQPTPGTARFVLEGVVDDVDGDGLERIGAFEAALGARREVVEAEIAGTPAERPGAMLAFELRVRVRARGGRMP